MVPGMVRRGTLVFALALVAAACGGASGGVTTPDGTATTTSSAATSSAPTSTTAGSAAPGGDAGPVAPASTTVPAEDLGDPAPDFLLALGEGGSTFSLSQEVLPVYMVFWAEW